VPEAEAERTPPVRRPDRREARWLGVGAADIGKETMVVRGFSVFDTDD